VIPGLVAGAVAAGLMGIVLMLGSGMLGRGFWTPLQQIGAVVLRDRWQEMRALSGVIGVVVHFAFGAFLGGIFALATQRLRARELLAMSGIVFAGLVYLFMTFLVLPWANPHFIYRTHVGRRLIAYLVYGLALGLGTRTAERVVPAPGAARHPRAV